MLSASSARRWSSRGPTPTLDSVMVVIIDINNKARESSSRAFDLFRVVGLSASVHPHSETESAGTQRVLIQQHEHAHARPQVNNTVLRFYRERRENAKWSVPAVSLPIR